MEIRESILGNLGVLLGRWSLLGNLGVLLGNWGVNSETLEFYLEIRDFTQKLWSLLENLEFLIKKSKPLLIQGLEHKVSLTTSWLIFYEN